MFEDELSEISEEELALSDGDPTVTNHIRLMRERRDDDLKQCFKGQRQRCRPFVHDGLSFYTLKLMEIDDDACTLCDKTSIWHRFLAVYKDERPLAVIQGSFSSDLTWYNRLDVALVRPRSIAKILAFERPNGRVDWQESAENLQGERLRDFKKAARRVLENELVEFSCRNAKERAELFGFVPYKTGRTEHAAPLLKLFFS